MLKEVKSRQAGRRVGTALFQTHLIRRKSHFPQVQVDFCAGQNVGVGLVVIERNAELGAYIVQTVAAQAAPLHDSNTVHRNGISGVSISAARQQPRSTRRSKLALWATR